MMTKMIWYITVTILAQMAALLLLKLMIMVKYDDATNIADVCIEGVKKFQLTKTENRTLVFGTFALLLI